MTKMDINIKNRVKDLIDELRTLFDIFGSPTAIHTKFANLQHYAIKRLLYLAYNIEDYN